jgi:carbon monoxide dehydrogenase subunit G
MTNEFRVAASPAQAWTILNDVERIAPCLPGAELQEIDGDEYRGIVKVKVGPITAQYKGAAVFVERDEGAGRVVLRAEGRETRGQGNAAALITATLTPDGDGTLVQVVTDLTITGKVAQFGRGVLADVSGKLMQQFADCLQADVLAGDPPAATTGSANGSAATDTPAAPAAPRAPAEPIDLLATAGAPTAKRALPVLATVIFLALVFRRRRRRRTQRALGS